MHPKPDDPLGEILTLHEAAERLKLTVQAVARAARASGHGSLFGRDWRFTEADLAGILAHRRVKTSPPLGHRVTASPSTDEVFEKARKLIERRKSERKAARGR